MLGPRGTTGVQRHRLVTAFRKCSPEHECPAGVQPLIQRLLLLSRESCSHTAIRVPKTCGLCSLKMEPEEVCVSRLLSLEMGSGCGESQGPHNALAPDAQCELQPVSSHPWISRDRHPCPQDSPCSSPDSSLLSSLCSPEVPCGQQGDPGPPHVNAQCSLNLGTTPFL